MFEARMQAGMTWIAERIQELGHTLGLDVVALGWDADIIDLKAHRHLLVVVVNGQRKVVGFDDAVLEDVIDQPYLQLTVDGDLGDFLSHELHGALLG